MMSCPDPNAMDRFVAGTASRSECREIVRHFLVRCAPCAALFKSAFQPPVEAGAYDAPLARLIDALPARAGCS